jgi:hypothetical protein
MCSACPFNPARAGVPIPVDVMQIVQVRIASGETWVCHRTCDGPRITDRSLLCAGAPPT